jgi:hypothetical protein
LFAGQKYAVLFIIQALALKITFYSIKENKRRFSFKKTSGKGYGLGGNDFYKYIKNR